MSDLFDDLIATGTPDEHNPGGKVMIELAPDVVGGARFGGLDNRFRYSLIRRWRCGPAVLVIMMNPSTANPIFDDPTIAKVTRMARRWHSGSFGRLLIGNVFAYRATYQDDLARVDDPVGPGNDRCLSEMASVAHLVVFAYGAPKTKALQRRGPVVVEMLRSAGIKPYVLRMGSLAPWHPLYLPDSTQPISWTNGSRAAVWA
jgi:hypothetical protein